jgi:hypothetical protein
MVRDESGGGLIELIMVMALLMLFGMTIFSLIYTGSETMGKIDESKNAQIDARIAMSYLNVRLRQNDGSNQVDIRKNHMNGQDAMVLRHVADDPLESYDTWIFWADGVLQEVLSETGGVPQWEASNPIVEVESFEANLSQGILTYSIEYEYEGSKRLLSSRVALRSLYGKGGV